MNRFVPGISVFSALFSTFALVTVGCASAPDEVLDEGDESGDVAGASEDALTGKACGGRAGNTCSAGQYCKFTLGAICGRADAQGVCARKPSSCTNVNSPVCGCNGVTYRNACLGRKNGQSALNRGACVPEPVACASDVDCTSADIGPNVRACILGTRATKACVSGACEWACKAPAPPSECPSGKKKCMMCGAPPPDGICRSFSCVAPSTPCPLVP
jgi:hypothetical protein